MFIITISRKQIRVAVLLIFAVALFLAVLIYLLTGSGSREDRKAISCNANLDNSSFVRFLASSGNIQKNIEIFDIVKGEVVKTSAVTPDIKSLAISYLNNLKNLYVKVNAFPDKGYIIKIPIDPPAKVQHALLNDYGITQVNEVFVIFPMNEEPYLLVLDRNYSPFFYNFEGATDRIERLLTSSIRTEK
ncbi:MAG TPA: hypothetical protein GXX49_07640 [Clostridiaceae bacterium]|jgi:hypothetical protein|nr:hypothetical protein [Clostridiaceae bacterium]